ncbi:MAG: hypothetical protein WAM58_09915 [Candidatus Acidiferrum sp.]
MVRVRTDGCRNAHGVGCGTFRGFIERWRAFIWMVLWIYPPNLSILPGAQTDGAVAGPVGVQS